MGRGNTITDSRNVSGSTDLAQGDLIAFVPTLLPQDEIIQVPRTTAPTTTPGSQNPPVGIPPGYGQPMQPGYTSPSTGIVEPGNNVPYISPRPSAGLDGLIQEGFGSRQQHEAMSILDGLISIARDSGDGRATSTVPVGNANNPQGYVNLTYDRNTGLLYTSDATGRDGQLYEYVPLTNLLGRLRLPDASSDVYDHYESLKIALTNDGRVPAYPKPQPSPSPVDQPDSPPSPTPAEQQVPLYTGGELRDRIEQFLPQSGTNEEFGGQRIVFGTDGRELATQSVVNWNKSSDTTTAIALEISYQDPNTGQRATAWVGYFNVDPKNVQSLAGNIHATGSFDVLHPETVLADSGLSQPGLEARIGRQEDRAFAANLPTAGKQLSPIFSNSEYEQGKATIANNNAIDIAANRIDEIDLIIPADDGRGAFAQNITRGQAVSLLNYAQDTGLLRDGVDLNSVIAANGLQDLIGVEDGRAVVKQNPPQSEAQTPAASNENNDWKETPGLNESEKDNLQEQFDRYGITDSEAQSAIAREVASGRKTAYEAITAYLDGRLGFDGGNGGNTGRPGAVAAPGDQPDDQGIEISLNEFQNVRLAPESLDDVFRPGRQVEVEGSNGGLEQWEIAGVTDNGVVVHKPGQPDQTRTYPFEQLHDLIGNNFEIELELMTISEIEDELSALVPDSGQSVTIGSDPENTVMAPEFMSASQNHLSFAANADGSYTLIERSDDGTMINTGDGWERIQNQSVNVQPGTRVRIGGEEGITFAVPQQSPQEPSSQGTPRGWDQFNYSALIASDPQGIISWPTPLGGYLSKDETWLLYSSASLLEADALSGYKARAVVDPSQLEQAFNVILPIAAEYGVPFKVPVPGVRTSKSFTFYDPVDPSTGRSRSPEEWASFLQAVEDALTNLNIRPGNLPTGDTRLQGSDYLSWTFDNTREVRNRTGSYIPADQRVIDPTQGPFSGIVIR